MMSVRDILGRLMGEPSSASVWAGTPRFRCCPACSVELSTFAEISSHRERCRRFFVWGEHVEPSSDGADVSDYRHRMAGCVCQDGASDE